MNRRRARRLRAAAWVAVALLTWAAPARAYGGPGSIVSGIGAFLAVLGAVVAALFGFVWYPMKKLLRVIRGRGSDESEGAGSAGEADVPASD